MINEYDLRIEFRAVPYGEHTTCHAVQYRICPDQDRTYYTYINVFGLFKIKIKRKYSTKWVQPIHFSNTNIAYMYPAEENYTPFLIWKKNEMDEFTTFKTLGQFTMYVENININEMNSWKKKRTEYLNERGVWYETI